MSFPTSVHGSPTKRFFVEMLTRDIELEDAILDLLDNCLDGAVRSQRSDRDENNKYEGFWARITITSQSFMIEDNCGGIPLSIAVDYAFRMGRGTADQDQRDSTLGTIGIYGIGMKRALFKMGSHAIITSCTEDHKFNVLIEDAWLQADNDWDFPLEEEERTDEDEYGTQILIESLHEGISQALSDPNFSARLAERISEHYSLIIKKGFRVYINDSNEPIDASVQRFLFVERGIKPYFFQFEKDGVSIFFAVGLNAPAQTAEDEDNAMSARRSYEEGGWTIYCNDRAILVRDKTRVTGWGDGVPTYHWQFSVISGVVEFTAKDASKLPVGTTKRSMDTSSELYLLVRKQMIGALKVFTDYTNAWRHERRAEQDPHFSDAKKLELRELKVQATKLVTSVKRGSDLVGARFHDPRAELVARRPASQTKTTRRIVYIKEIDEIKEVGTYLLDDPSAKPSDVGEKCFSLVLEQARGGK